MYGFLTSQLLMTFQIPILVCISLKILSKLAKHTSSAIATAISLFFHFCFIQNMTQVGRVHDLVQQRSAELPGVDNSPLTTLQQQHQLFFKCFHFWESQNALILEK